MNLIGTAPGIGRVHVSVSTSIPSIGEIAVTAIDGTGALTAGDGSFNIYLVADLPDQGITVENGTPIYVNGSISSLPAVPADYYSPVSFSPVLIADTSNQNGVGYVCGLNIHTAACEPACCVGMRGDVNGDGDDANIIDLTFTVDYIFRGSHDPGPCPEEGDVNADASDGPDILDLTFLVDKIFRGGIDPYPCL